MANYYTDRDNYFLQHASEIYEYLSGDSLSRYAHSSLLNYNNYDEVSLRIKEVTGYRKLKDSDVNIATISNSVASSLSSSHSSDIAVGYFLVSDGRSTRLFFGSEDNGFENNLRSVLPELHIRDNIRSKVFCRASNYSGIVTGAFRISEDVVDTIMNAMEGGEMMVAILAIPADGISYTIALSELALLSSRYNNQNNTFGNNGRRQLPDNFPGNRRLLDFLNRQGDRFSEDGNDIWETAIWFTANRESDRNALGDCLVGAFNRADEIQLERAGCFYINTNGFRNGRLHIPTSRYRNIGYDLDSNLIKGDLISYMTSKELASLFQLPLYSHSGIEVIDADITSDSMRTFAYNSSGTDTADSFVLGSMDESRQPLYVKLDAIQRHVLVTGTPGSGKSNTVKHILEEVARANKNFCVLESAKKEYWELIGSVNDLQVYSAGYDALPLRLNPFEPEDGVVIGNHIDELMYAFSGAFDWEDRIRMDFKGLLGYTYEKLGWKSYDEAYKYRGRYPSFEDLMNNLYEYSDKEIRSSSEIKRDIEGAIYSRGRDLRSGISGLIFQNGSDSRTLLTGERLCTGHNVVELDDLSTDAKSFVLSILLIKIKQYIYRQNETSHLRNVLVLEEAHNVMADIPEGTVKSSKSITSTYFSDMLSEVRAYGMGMIIADQSPSRINQSAIRNTSVKIIHETSDRRDMESVSYALGLSEYQESVLPTMRTGQALVSLPEGGVTSRVNVQHSNTSVKNVACIFCKSREFCCYERVKNKVRMDADTVLTIEIMLTAMYDGRRIREMVDNFATKHRLETWETLCALGYVLMQSGSRGMREYRKLIYRYTGGER